MSLHREHERDALSFSMSTGVSSAPGFSTVISPARSRSANVRRGIKRGSRRPRRKRTAHALAKTFRSIQRTHSSDPPDHPRTRHSTRHGRRSSPRRISSRVARVFRPHSTRRLTMRASTSAILRRVARLARGRPALATPATLVAGRRPPPGISPRASTPPGRPRPTRGPSPRRGVGSAPPLLPRPCSIRFAPWWVRVLAGRRHPPDFSLDDFAALAVKTKREPPMAAGLLDTLSVDPFQIEAITKVMTEAEKATPGRLRTPEHRRVAARGRGRDGRRCHPGRMSPPSSTAAMLRIIMNRVNRETARAAAHVREGVRGDGREESGERHAGREEGGGGVVGGRFRQTDRARAGLGKSTRRAAVPSEGAGEGESS